MDWKPVVAMFLSALAIILTLIMMFRVATKDGINVAKIRQDFNIWLRKKRSIGGWIITIGLITFSGTFTLLIWLTGTSSGSIVFDLFVSLVFALALGGRLFRDES